MPARSSPVSAKLEGKPAASPAEIVLGRRLEGENQEKSQERR